MSDVIRCSVVSREAVPWTVVYDYAMDRLRAVRQDVVIQSLDRWDTLSLLRPMVRFYTYAGYRLCEQPPHAFDRVINNQHLLECLKRVLCLYDGAARCTDSRDERELMECLYLLVAPGNAEALERALLLPRDVRTARVRLCLRTSLEMARGNYVRVCRAVRDLHDMPLLLVCAATHVMPRVRRQCLRTMALAYSSRGALCVPPDHLARLLLYGDVQSLTDDCRYYGLQVTDAGVRFSNDSFRHEKPMVICLLLLSVFINGANSYTCDWLRPVTTLWHGLRTAPIDTNIQKAFSSSLFL